VLKNPAFSTRPVIKSESRDTYDLITLFRKSFSTPVAYSQATDWPDGIRTLWRSPTFMAHSYFTSRAYWISYMRGLIHPVDTDDTRSYHQILNTLCHGQSD
jgi:hypothetical protein